MAGSLFETAHIHAPFPTGPLFEREELEFENDRFFREVPSAMPDGIAKKVDTVNSSRAKTLIQETAPDFGIVFGTRKIDREVIGLFPDGLINVHRGISQEYRGLDSDLWAIYHSDYSNLGVTLHRVEPSLDTGEIVRQERMPIYTGMKVHHIRYHTTCIAANLAVSAVRDYLEERMEGRPQEKKGRYYSFMPLELKNLVAVKFNRHCESIEV